MFQNFKHCCSNNKNVYRSQQRFKSVDAEEVNKIAVSTNDDKRLQTYNITTYPYGTKWNANGKKIYSLKYKNNQLW